MKHRILIVDDETMLTDLLSNHFYNEGYDTYTASNCKEALEKLKIKPDIILLDINMPDSDGISFCRTIRNLVACPIIFLTARITEQDMVNGLRSGGDDYVTKPFSLRELSARVEAHLRRDARKQVSADILSSNGLFVNLTDYTVHYEDKEISFSKREFEIIEFLIAHPNQVFDKERIYEAVWGYDAEGDSNVIKEHIRKIRMKLYEATQMDYIETVWGMGYKWKK